MSAWIRMIQFAESTGYLRSLYERIRGPNGEIDNVMKIHSLRPHTMEGHWVLYKSVMHHADNTLPGWFHECMAVYVGLCNDCGYSVGHHFAGLKRLLKNDARLSWPLALRDEPYKTDRELVNSLAPEAVRQAVNGRVDAGTLRELTNAAQRLRENLATNIKDMTANQYTEASRFLGFLEDAIRVLGRPDAGDFFTRKYAAQGKDIGELVRNLTSKGLRFAAATPGDEPAYLAVHRALTVYDRGAKAEVASEGRAGDSKP